MFGTIGGWVRRTCSKKNQKAIRTNDPESCRCFANRCRRLLLPGWVGCCGGLREVQERDRKGSRVAGAALCCGSVHLVCRARLRAVAAFWLAARLGTFSWPGRAWEAGSLGSWSQVRLGTAFSSQPSLEHFQGLQELCFTDLEISQSRGLKEASKHDSHLVLLKLKEYESSERHPATIVDRRQVCGQRGSGWGLR